MICQVVANRLTITGFIVLDFISEYPAAMAKLGQAVANGTFVVEGTEEVREVPFEDIPRVWMDLFVGGNTGKLVTKIAY
jgi:NADPH-dependent curcumin reductase CurA